MTMGKEDQLSQQMLPVITRIFGFNYNVDKLIASTRTCCAFKAFNIKDKCHELIWISRFPVADEGDGAFSKRMRDLEKLTFSPQAKTVGIDGEMRPYLVQTYVGMRHLGYMGPAHLEQALVYLDDMVRAVAQVHYVGYELGDLSVSSFIVDGDGRLWLGSIIGPVREGNSLRSEEASKSDASYYLAPEVARSGQPSKIGDVFALGAIFYFLLTGKWIANTADFKELGTKACVAPSELCSGAPNWIDGLIAGCLHSDPDLRFSDAVKVLEFMEGAKKGAMPSSYLALWATSALSEHVSNGESSHASKSGRSRIPKDNTVSKDTSGTNIFSYWLRTAMLGVCVLGLALYLAFRFLLVLNPGGDSQVASYSFQKMENLPIDVKSYLQDLVALDVASAQRREILHKVALNSSPLINQVVFDIARGEMGPELAEFAIDLMEERIRNNGLNVTADLFSQWRKKEKSEGRVAGGTSILWPLIVAADPRVVPEERKKAIYDLYGKEKEFGLQYACAVAIDQENTGEFLEPFRELLSLKYPNIRIGGVSLGALVLGFREPSMKFGAFMLPKVTSMSNSDLEWLLKRDTVKEFKIFLLLSKEVLKRRMLKPEREFFFEVLDEKWPVASPKVLDALTAAAQGNTTTDTVLTLAEWYSPKQDLVLLRLCALEQDLGVAQVAFEKALNRSVTSEPMKGIVNWVRVNSWGDRGKFAKPVVIIAFPEEYGFDKAKEAFTSLSEIMDKKTLFESFMRSTRPEYIVFALEAFGSKAVPSDLMPLLKHENSSVRIAALKSLRSTNTLEQRKVMTKRYAEEQDPTVRAAYEEFHPYVKIVK